MASVLWPETTFFIIAFLRQGSPLDQFEELFTIKALAKLENNQLTSAHLMVAANDYKYRVVHNQTFVVDLEF